MKTLLAASLGAALTLLLPAAEPPPKAGPVALFPLSEVKPGLKGTAWTVFEGSTPEAIPVEIIGRHLNAWGPRQDIILAKLGGKAARTNVAGGMSGSPVYIDGKLVGAIALRFSVFSPDAICGITPIEYMLEINEFDKSRPPDMRSPVANGARNEIPIPSEVLPRPVGSQPVLIPIETPLMFSGMHENTLREFRPIFEQMGITAVQGGAAGSLKGAVPQAGWQAALQPGEAIAGVLVSGDMSITGLGTVTYNDGKRVLGFGHSFFNLGPLSMPMAKGEVLMVLSSAFQPNKFANATGIVGALHQDRHSGIMGVLGGSAETIPVSLKVKSLNGSGAAVTQKNYTMNMFVHQKWTPFLMMLSVFNTLQGINDFADETTYRFSGNVEFQGGKKLNLATMLAANDLPIPPAMQLAAWYAERFNRLFNSPIDMPKLKSVDASIELLPERRSAAIESAWLDVSEALPGDTVKGRFALRPYRGERVTRDFQLKLPTNLPKGDHRLLISDADTLNRMQSLASSLNRNLNPEQIVSLLNQERPNDRVYLSLIEPRPTVYTDDKALASLPASVLNAMQGARSAGKSVAASPETANEQQSIALGQMITGQASIRITVK